MRPRNGNEYEVLVNALEKMLDEVRDRYWTNETKSRVAVEQEASLLRMKEAAVRAEQLRKERLEYEEFCIRLVGAGAAAGKIPSLAAWRGV